MKDLRRDNADVDASWAASKWRNVIAGSIALNSQGRGGSGTVIRTINFTEYGPVPGLSFTFRWGMRI